MTALSYSIIYGLWYLWNWPKWYLDVSAQRQFTIYWQCLTLQNQVPGRQAVLLKNTDIVLYHENFKGATP